jgi:hypothetical protein
MTTNLFDILSGKTIDLIDLHEFFVTASNSENGIQQQLIPQTILRTPRYPNLIVILVPLAAPSTWFHQLIVSAQTVKHMVYSGFAASPSFSGYAPVFFTIPILPFFFALLICKMFRRFTIIDVFKFCLERHYIPSYNVLISTYKIILTK